MSDRRTPQQKKDHDDYVKRRFERWKEAGEAQTRQTFKQLIGSQTVETLPTEKKSTLLGSTVDGIFKRLRPVPGAKATSKAAGRSVRSTRSKSKAGYSPGLLPGLIA
jgi:hypothetical protein